MLQTHLILAGDRYRVCASPQAHIVWHTLSRVAFLAKKSRLPVVAITLRFTGCFQSLSSFEGPLQQAAAATKGGVVAAPQSPRSKKRKKRKKGEGKEEGAGSPGGRGCVGGGSGVVTAEMILSWRPALEVHGWLLDLDTRCGGCGMGRDGKDCVCVVGVLYGGGGGGGCLFFLFLVESIGMNSISGTRAIELFVPFGTKMAGIRRGRACSNLAYDFFG